VCSDQSNVSSADDVRSTNLRVATSAGSRADSLSDANGNMQQKRTGMKPRVRVGEITPPSRERPIRKRKGAWSCAQGEGSAGADENNVGNDVVKNVRAPKRCMRRKRMSQQVVGQAAEVQCDIQRMQV
jgi:hypothetical protein